MSSFPRFEARALIAISGAALLAFTLPAAAQADPSVNNAYALNSPESSAGDNARPAPRPGSAGSPTEDTRRICVRDTQTGSRISRRICYTRQQWEERGGLIEDE